MRKLTCDSQLEVLGQNMRALIDNLKSERTRPIMEKYRIADAEPDEWYPAIWLMDALDEMAQDSDVMFNMVAIGMSIGEMMPLAVEYDNPTLEQALMDWDASYQAIHRNGDAGGIQVEKVSDTHFKVSFTDLYPDDWSYGIMFGQGRRFLPPGTNFKVIYDAEITPRDKGGQGPTVIHIQW